MSNAPIYAEQSNIIESEVDEGEVCLSNLHTARLFKSLNQRYSKLNNELHQFNNDEITLSESFHQYNKSFKILLSTISNHDSESELLRISHLDVSMHIDKAIDSVREVIASKKAAADAELNGLSTKLNHLREIISVGMQDLIKPDDINKKVCPVCFDREVNTVLVPCGHTYCEGCLKYGSYSRCPQCRETIQRRIKMYFTV
jgi:DNA mismatch repair ATPase MutS